MIKSKVKNEIPQEELYLASCFFALGNLATDFVYAQAKRSDGKIDLKYAWDLSEGILISETGVSGEEEREDWKQTILAGSKFCNEEWAAEKHKFKI